MNQHRQPVVSEKKVPFLFPLFYLWTFVLLGRPQDYLIILASLRPALVLGILTLVAFFISYSRVTSEGVFGDTQTKLFFALTCLMVIEIPFSIYPRGSFMAVFKDYSMVVLFFYMFFIMVNSVEKVLTLLLVGCLSTGLYSVFALISGGPLGQRLQFGGVFDPNDLSFFTLSFLPFNLLFVRRGVSFWKKIACTVSFVASVIVILQSGSRGGLLGLLAAFLVLFVTRTHTVRFSTKGLLMVLCAILVMFNFSKIDISRYKSITNIQGDYNVYDETGRIAIWKIGMKAMLASPLTGVGPGCFNEAVGRDRKQRGLVSQRWQAPHNMLVQIGTETGVIGLFLFLLMSLNVFRSFGRAKKKSASEDIIRVGEMGRIGFLGHFISAMFLSHAYSFYWAFYIVLSAVVNQLLVHEGSQ
jgi:O-antigen ligase